MYWIQQFDRKIGVFYGVKGSFSLEKYRIVKKYIVS